MSDKGAAGRECAPVAPTPRRPEPTHHVTRHTIEVKAVANGHSIDWEVDRKKPEQARLKLDRNSGGHEITFDLDPDQALKNRGLRFQCAAPIFVHDEVATCPNSGVDKQIDVLECSRGTLKIFDKNTGPEKLLRYQLNFVESNGGAQVCDPIIENGGSD